MLLSALSGLLLASSMLRGSNFVLYTLVNGPAILYANEVFLQPGSLDCVLTGPGLWPFELVLWSLPALSNFVLDLLYIDLF